MTAFRIEPMSDATADKAAAIHLTAFDGIGQTAASFHAARTASGVTSVVALAEDGQVTAYAMYQVHGTSAYLSWCGVAEPHRRNGIGRALLTSVIDACKAAGARHLNLESRNRYKFAIMLYLGLDFDIIGLWQNTDGEMMVRLTKTLG